MPLFQRDQFKPGHSFMEEAYTYRGQNEYNFLTLRLNGRSDIKIHALVFFSAFPWLKIDVVDDFFVIIGDDSEIDPPCLAIFDKLLHFGEATCPDKKVLNNAQVLCDFFGMSVSFDEIVSKCESSDVPRDDLDNEVSSDNDENETKSKLKKVKRRVFTANLSNDDLTCSICNRTFSAMYKLKIHKLIHSKTPPFVCSHCGRGFNNKYKMRGHEKRHCSSIDSKDIKASWPYSERLEKRISCEKCGALFDTKKARREHIIAAHPFAATHFSCSLCQKSFRGLKGLKSHQQNVDCQKSKRQARSQSEKTSDFKCDKCPVMCTSKKSLKVHAKTLHFVDGEDTLPFHCDICDKSFLKNSYFEEHQNRFHADIKPFPCMYCPKRCATKQDLDRHLTSHRGESIYQCAFCSRGFVHRASLTRHQRRHLGERPYHCHPCGKGYGLLSVLQKHQRLHERKADKTRIVTAPKGRRGILTYIEFIDDVTTTKASASLSATGTDDFDGSIGTSAVGPSETYHQTDFSSGINVYRDQANYQVLNPIRNNQGEVSETESIAMDILGLLDDEQRSDKPMEETLHKIHF